MLKTKLMSLREILRASRSSKSIPLSKSRTRTIITLTPTPAPPLKTGWPQTTKRTGWPQTTKRAEWSQTTTKQTAISRSLFKNLSKNPQWDNNSTTNKCNLTKTSSVKITLKSNKTPSNWSTRKHRLMIKWSKKFKPKVKTNKFKLHSWSKKLKTNN